MFSTVSLRPEPLTGAPIAGAYGFVRRASREALRLLVVGVGSLLIAAGFVLALLPGHLGLPLLVIGLILVLRNSPKARRQFIELQHRHPRMVFPVRRLIRREPEVFPVLWQQALRLERLIVPPTWRRAGQLRRRYLRRRA
ncbi:hypothetical protein [Phenylobacterium montanum]|uniref:hypothetical protein n=1 Tax=Phenylobacterium montanum TaxID=2823693 RepID=UPI002011E1D0|nr:hypothetical protein [Caulobacter sp. S6]